MLNKYLTTCGPQHGYSGVWGNIYLAADEGSSLVTLNADTHEACEAKIAQWIAEREASEALKTHAHIIAQDDWTVVTYAMKRDAQGATLFDPMEHDGEPDFWDIIVRPDTMNGDENLLEFEDLTRSQADIFSRELEKRFRIDSDYVEA